jgi:hypothetical protein
MLVRLRLCHSVILNTREMNRMKPVDERILQMIQYLEYDFRQFTLPHFVTHLSRRRRRDILVNSYPFEPELHGLWVRAETADYVITNSLAHPIHQVHNVLHELGHILLQHPCQDLSAVLPPPILALVNGGGAQPAYGLLRKIELDYTPQEVEAEVLVRQLQRRIIFADRLEQLTGQSSSLEPLTPFTRSLGYHD